MYRFYNANVLGNFVNDCTIRAISLAEGNTWDNTYDKLSDLAQQKGTMMDDKYFIRDYLNSHYKRVDVSGTVGQVASEYSDEVCLITMSGHITCSVYGVIYDSFDCRRRQAEYLWIIKD
jgi:hypothetical protein